MIKVPLFLLFGIICFCLEKTIALFLNGKNNRFVFAWQKQSLCFASDALILFVKIWKLILGFVNPLTITVRKVNSLLLFSGMVS